MEALGKHKPVLVCTNRDGARGQLYCSDLCSPCRSYRTIPVIDRPAVVQPTDSTSSPQADSKIRLIPLTKGKVAIVDAADYDWLSSFKWAANQKPGGVYACRNVKRKNILMHRMIMNAPVGKFVDHIDRNGLNNRRCNLRLCSFAENIRNTKGWGKTSRYKGVTRRKKDKKWISSIRYNNKFHYIGYFENETDAARAYDKAARKFFGQFAYLNFPDEKATPQ